MFIEGLWDVVELIKLEARLSLKGRCPVSLHDNP